MAIFRIILFFTVMIVTASTLGFTASQFIIPIIVDVGLTIVLSLVFAALYKLWDDNILDDTSTLGNINLVITLGVYSYFQWTIDQIYTLCVVLLLFSIGMRIFERTWVHADQRY